MNHFLDVSDYSPAEIQDILDLAIRLKKEYFAGGNQPLFKGKVLGMIFQKPSLRTRVSFDMAMRHMGGDALYLSPNEIGLGKRESIADVSRCHGARFRSCTCSGTGKMVICASHQWPERFQPSLPGDG